MAEFKVVSEYSPAGDQPQAIAALADLTADANGITEGVIRSMIISKDE